MLVCKNAIITFWNALWSKNNKQINFITVLFFHTAPLHFMENKAHFVPLIRPRKVQYMHVHTVQAHVQYMHMHDTRMYMCTFMHIATKYLHTTFYWLITMAQIVAFLR